MAHLITFNLLIGSTIFVFIFSILLTSSISFALGYSISWIEIFLATCISLAFDWWGINRYFKEHKLKTFGILCSLVLFMFLISVYVSGRFYDLSYDGQAYHQEAIIQLANGWNPFYEDLIPESTSHYVLINSYSKGAWIPAAALYKITGSIEQSKAFNFLLIFASLFISFSAALCFNKITLKTAAILSVLLSFNPVSIYQSLSFYVDGQLSSLLVSLASLAYLLFSRWDKIIMLVIALNIILAFNVKFTGVVYASIFILGLLTYFFLYGKAKFGSRVIILSVISILVGIFFIGYSPYIRNTLRYGHPFYPLLGPRSVDVVTSNVPGNFLGMNRFERLFLSIFSKSENVLQPAVSRLKWPFTVSRNELNTFGSSDTRVGGWGPVFGGAIIISMVILFIALGLDLPKTKIAAGASLLIMISIILNWESWWARFSPQLWIIPMPFFILSKYIQKRLLKHFGHILILVLAINVILVSISYIRWQYHINGLLKQQLASVAKQQDQVLVNFGDFRSNRVRFNELGIKYKEIKEFECLKYTQLISSNAKICNVFDKIITGTPDGMSESRSTVCDGFIDVVNGISPAPGSLTISKTLSVDGWMAISAKDGIVPDAVFVTLSDENGKKIYIKARRTPRLDVKEYFKQPRMPDPGYTAFIDVSTLSGKYKLGLSRVYKGTLESCQQFNLPLLITR